MQVESRELEGARGNLRELEGTRGNLRKIKETQGNSKELVEGMEGKNSAQLAKR